jgi:hypothetical protein
VRDVVQDNVQQAKVVLQEIWAEAGDFVVDVCRQRVRTCDACMGLFGDRYGWQPPGFTWAVERWAQRAAPIFILLPEKGSEADTQLHGWTRPYRQHLTDDEVRSRANLAARRQRPPRQLLANLSTAG